MQKFWRTGCRKRVRELENEFTGQSNIISGILLDLYDDIDDFSEECLRNHIYPLLDLLDHLDELDREYRSFFIFSRGPHPDYRRFVLRVRRLYDIIDGEIYKRCLD